MDVSVEMTQKDWFKTIYSMLEGVFREDPVLSRLKDPAERFLQYTIYDGDFEENMHYVAKDDNGRIVGAIGFVRRPWKSSRKGTAFLQYLVVDKQFRGRGIGTLLWKRAIKDLSALNITKIELFACAPNYLWPGLPVSMDESVFKFFSEMGVEFPSDRADLLTEFHEIRYYRKKLEAISDYIGEMGFEIRNINSMNTNGRYLVSEFIGGAFSRSWLIESSEAFAQGTLNVIIDVNRREGKKNNNGNYPGKVVGFAAFNATNLGWFGPMGVDEDYRRKGLGAALVLSSIVQSYNMGLEEWVIPWVSEENIRFYKSIFRENDISTRICKKGIMELAP